MATSPKLQLLSGMTLDDPCEYRMVFGSLQYLAFTHPDIAYSVNRLSQFMHHPTDIHWQVVKRVLRYLSGTMSHGIFLSTRSPISFHVFSDADWAGNVDDFVSTNAYTLYLGTTPITWSSKKQTYVARSSTEVEYRYVANADAEISWFVHSLQSWVLLYPILRFYIVTTLVPRTSAQIQFFILV